MLILSLPTSYTWCNKYKINKRRNHCQFALGINPILGCLFTKLQVSEGEDFLAENFQLFTEIMISANKTAIWIISQVRVECTHNLLITTSFTQIVKIYRGSMDPLHILMDQARGACFVFSLNQKDPHSKWIRSRSKLGFNDTFTTLISIPKDRARDGSWQATLLFNEGSYCFRILLKCVVMSLFAFSFYMQCIFYGQMKHIVR